MKKIMLTAAAFIFTLSMFAQTAPAAAPATQQPATKTAPKHAKKGKATSGKHTKGSHKGKAKAKPAK